MKYLLLSALLLTLSISTYAIPAKKELKTVYQSDGSELTIYLNGDETFHFFSTTDGYPLTKTSDGSYSYAKLNNGCLESSGVLAHNESLRNFSEKVFLQYDGVVNNNAIRFHWSERMMKRNAQRLRNQNQLVNNPRLFKSPAYNATSKKKGLVILVNYTDKKMRSSTIRDDIDDQFNTSGYNKAGHIGSVSDYFKDQSYGQLTIDFDVVGPYTLNNNMAYYGKNDSHGDDMHAGEMVAEACKMADSDVKFSDYDWNGDGWVDQVYVIYAGYGEASGAPSTTIWPHEWELYSSDYGNYLTLDGVHVNTYACSCELSGVSGSKLNSIGTACHEFSHCLGLPDFYDTSGRNFGMATWSLMDYGCYNGPSSNDGAVPCAFTAYERFFSGWLNPEVLDEGCEILDMHDITSSKDAYIIYNDANENVWYENAVNTNSSRQRCTIIPADNASPALGSTQTSWNSLSGDPYPGTSNNTELTNTSSPASKLYNENIDGTNLMSKPIESIKESDGIISFTFNGGKPVPVPEMLSVTNITEKSFTATWNAVEGADSYTLELEETYKSALTEVFSEDFSGLSRVTNTGLDISGQLDNYLSQSGWSGENLYSGFSGSNTGIKLGTAKQTGTLTTPELTAPSNGEVTIYFVSSPYGIAPEAIISVSVNGGEEEVFAGKKSGNVMNISGLSGKYKVSFSTTNPTRGYINSIKIFNGIGDVEDIEKNSKERKSSPSKAKRTFLYPGLTSTSYTFTDLVSYNYRFRIKAITVDSESKWSDFVSVVLPGGTDAISTLSSNNSSDIVEVYSLGGVLLKRSTISSWSHGLNHGIYIVRQNGVNKKVIKK